MIRSCFILSPIVQLLIFGACAGIERNLTRDNVNLTRDDVQETSIISPPTSSEPQTSSRVLVNGTSPNTHEESGVEKLWRDDGRCGYFTPLPSGEPAQCNPNHPNGWSCCSARGWCGSDCYCNGCHDYRHPSCHLDGVYGLDAEFFNFDPLSLKSVGSMLTNGNSVTVNCKPGLVNVKDNNLKHAKIDCSDGKWNTTLCVNMRHEVGAAAPGNNTSDCRLTQMPDHASIDSWKLLPKTLRHGEIAKIQCEDGHISERSKQLKIDAVCDEGKLKIFDRCIKRTDNCVVHTYPACIQFEEFDGQHRSQSFFSSDASEAVLKDAIEGNPSAESSKPMSIKVEGTDRCELRFTLDSGEVLHIKPSDGIVCLRRLPDPTPIDPAVFNLFFGYQDKFKPCVFPEENEQCQFPFTYEGVTYHGCMESKFFGSQCIVNKSTMKWKVCSGALHCKRHTNFHCYTPAQFLAVISPYWFSYDNFDDETQDNVPKKCPPGYVQEGKIELKKCSQANSEFSVSGCKKAQCEKNCTLCDKDDPSKCLECDKFYARDPATGTCVRCAKDYAYCIGGHEDRYLSEKPCGFGLTSQPLYGQCYRCEPGCDSCKTQFTCQRNGCSKGYTYQEGKCIVCETGCKDCLSYQPCEEGTCADNFEYLKSTKTCYRKGKNCLEFGMAKIGGDKVCTRCSFQYQLNEDGKCVEKKCTSDICLRSWDLGISWDNGNICIDDGVKDGMKIRGTEYVVHKRGVCGSECPIRNCAECDSNSKCIHCPAGFALRGDGQCFEFCAPGCKYCFVKGGCNLELPDPCTRNFHVFNNTCVRNRLFGGGLPPSSNDDTSSGSPGEEDEYSFLGMVVGIACSVSVLLVLMVGLFLYMRPPSGRRHASDGLSSELSDTVLDEILRRNSIVIPTLGHPYARSSGAQQVVRAYSGGPGPPSLAPSHGVGGSSIISGATKSIAGGSEGGPHIKSRGASESHAGVEFACRPVVRGSGIGEAPGTVNVQWPPPEYEDIAPAGIDDSYAAHGSSQQPGGTHAAGGTMGLLLYPSLAPPLSSPALTSSNNDDIRSIAGISDISRDTSMLGHENAAREYSERQELPVPPPAGGGTGRRPRSNRTTQSRSAYSGGGFVDESV